MPKDETTMPRRLWDAAKYRWLVVAAVKAPFRNVPIDWDLVYHPDHIWVVGNRMHKRLAGVRGLTFEVWEIGGRIL